MALGHTSQFRWYDLPCHNLSSRPTMDMTRQMGYDLLCMTPSLFLEFSCGSIKVPYSLQSFLNHCIHLLGNYCLIGVIDLFNSLFSHSQQATFIACSKVHACLCVGLAKYYCTYSYFHFDHWCVYYFCFPLNSKVGLFLCILDISYILCTLQGISFSKFSEGSPLPGPLIGGEVKGRTYQ